MKKIDVFWCFAAVVGRMRNVPHWLLCVSIGSQLEALLWEVVGPIRGGTSTLEKASH